MKWKLFDIADINSMYKLPRKVGFEKGSDNRGFYTFSYVTPLSKNVMKKEFPIGVVVVESGSNRIASVLLSTQHSEGSDVNSKMRQAVFDLFSSTGQGIDEDEQEFLDLIDEGVVSSEAFSR